MQVAYFMQVKICDLNKTDRICYLNDPIKVLLKWVKLLHFPLFFIGCTGKVCHATIRHYNVQRLPEGSKELQKYGIVITWLEVYFNLLMWDVWHFNDVDISLGMVFKWKKDLRNSQAIAIENYLHLSPWCVVSERVGSLSPSSVTPSIDTWSTLHITLTTSSSVTSTPVLASYCK